MQKTRINDMEIERITVSAETLAKMLDCGRATAVKIGEEAGARIKIGRRVLFNVVKINAYLEKNYC